MSSLTLLQPPRKPLRWRAKTRSAALDWLTCTAKPDGSSEALWSVGDRVLSENELIGYKATRWQAHGYRGWCSEGIRLGARGDGALLYILDRRNWLGAREDGWNCIRGNE